MFDPLPLARFVDDLREPRLDSFKGVAEVYLILARLRDDAARD
jgi:hypothetical protein